MTQVVEPTSATLYLPSSGHISKFSLLCQAAALLGEVLEHISKPVEDQKIYEEEGLQLVHTLRAMISTSESMDTPDHDQISMIYGYVPVVIYSVTYNSHRSLSNAIQHTYDFLFVP